MLLSSLRRNCHCSSDQEGVTSVAEAGICPTHEEGMFPFSESSGTQTPHHITSVLLWQAQTCLGAHRQPATEATQNLIQFPDRCSITSLPSDCSLLSPRSLLESKNPPLCLLLSNFPHSLVHSVSFVWGDTDIVLGMIVQRKCSGFSAVLLLLAEITWL